MQKQSKELFFEEMFHCFVLSFICCWFYIFILQMKGRKKNVRFKETQNTRGNSSRKMLCTYLMNIKRNAQNKRWISVERQAFSIGDWHNWPQRKQFEHFRVASLWVLFIPVKRTMKKIFLTVRRWFAFSVWAFSLF